MLSYKETVTEAGEWYCDNIPFYAEVQEAYIIVDINLFLKDDFNTIMLNDCVKR